MEGHTVIGLGTRNGESEAHCSCGWWIHGSAGATGAALAQHLGADIRVEKATVRGWCRRAALPFTGRSAGELDASNGRLGGGDLGRRGDGGGRGRADRVDGAAGVAGVDEPGRALDRGGRGLGLGGGSPEDERGGDQGAGKQEASHAPSVVSPPPPVKDFLTEHVSVIVVDPRYPGLRPDDLTPMTVEERAWFARNRR